MEQATKKKSKRTGAHWLGNNDKTLTNRASTPGMHADGAGLWMNVTPSLTRSWIHRYMLHGCARTMGLGRYPEVSIAEARAIVAENRRKIRTGIDPITEKQELISAARASNAKSVTFDWCADKFINSNKAEWKNPKHIDQWKNTLATYASPTIGKLSVDKIDTAHIVKLLEEDSFWTTKTETASRVRGRIETVLDWATVSKYRTGENPARWKGHLEALLPKPSKVKKVTHHAALPWAEMKDFMKALRMQDGVAARALEFAILCAARSGEVRGMTWSEVDLDAGVWLVPGDRMKAKREHRVPLSQRSKEILTAAKDWGGDIVFPGIKEGKPLSDMSLTAVLKRMSRGDLTAHGFRSSFRDWAAEADGVNYPAEMAEMALAHIVGDKVEAAYRRGDMFDKRRQMMADWAKHCGC